MTRWPDQIGQLYSLESEADSAAKALVALEKAQAAEQEDVFKFYWLDKLAAEYLLKAGATSGSPQLDSFGPNMSLAKELLEKDQREPVLLYFELCRKFWEMGGERLDRWTKEVNAGITPDFGGSLAY